MKITLTDAGKRFNRDWIFRHVNFQFTNGNSYAITGPNGSGKSTLLQVIAGAMAASEGRLDYEPEVNNKTLTSNKVSVESSAISRPVSTDDVYKYISITAPYLEVIEEMTLVEFFEFHQRFKPFLPAVDSQAIIDILGLEKSAHKQMRYYSSGMKQRVKLAQAIFSDTPVLLLDEPCTNLDKEGISLYLQLIKDYCADRLVIISSNDEVEYGFCKNSIDISAYKK